MNLTVWGLIPFGGLYGSHCVVAQGMPSCFCFVVQIVVVEVDADLPENQDPKPQLEVRAASLTLFCRCPMHKCTYPHYWLYGLLKCSTSWVHNLHFSKLDLLGSFIGWVRASSMPWLMVCLRLKNIKMGYVLPTWGQEARYFYAFPFIYQYFHLFCSLVDHKSGLQYDNTSNLLLLVARTQTHTLCLCRLVRPSKLCACL
jgi:hypothetical protein